MTEYDLMTQVEDVAKEVYRLLGDGREERVYEQAMAVEFRLRDIPYEMEVPKEIFYKEQRVGTAVLDFIVDKRLVVELKATKKIAEGHVSQAGAYMRETGITAGIVVTFPSPAKPDPEFECVHLST